MSALHPGIDPQCPTCRGDGYVVARDGELARAARCRCVAACPACNDTGWIAPDPARPRARTACGCRKLGVRVGRFNDARVPGRHATSTLGSFAPYERPIIKVRKRVEDAAASWRRDVENRGLVLWGDVGRGKTHLLCGVLRELVFRHGVSARFVEFSHLLADIKGGFDRGQGAATLIDELVAVDVLAIDELGKGRNTEFEGTVLDELISRRYNAQRPILATTNYPPAASTGRAAPNLASPIDNVALVDRIGPRVFSRLRETCDFVEVVGGDFRARLGGDPSPASAPRRGA